MGFLLGDGLQGDLNLFLTLSCAYLGTSLYEKSAVVPLICNRGRFRQILAESSCHTDLEG
jgi:hypothetical protein